VGIFRSSNFGELPESCGHSQLTLRRVMTKAKNQGRIAAHGAAYVKCVKWEWAVRRKSGAIKNV
jgi:hypothetical protein